MKKLDIAQELNSNAYPGRGIIIGRSADGNTAVIGTINFDYRSLYLHFEDAAFMQDTACIPDIKADFEDLFKNKCHRITHEDVRQLSFASRFMSVILRIFAPML